MGWCDSALLCCFGLPVEHEYAKGFVIMAVFINGVCDGLV